MGRGDRDVARVRGAPRCIGAPPAAIFAQDDTRPGVGDAGLFHTLVVSAVHGQTPALLPPAPRDRGGHAVS
jgi:hypothetical protein